MKKEYISPDVEYISLIAEEKVTGDLGDGSQDVVSGNIFG